MDELIRPLLALLQMQAAHLRATWGSRRDHGPVDAGLSTLELAIIALGLMAIAGVLVAVLVTAVNSRTSKIK